MTRTHERLPPGRYESGMEYKTDGSRCRMGREWFSDVAKLQTSYGFSRNCTSSLNFHLFPRLVIYDTILCNVWQWEGAAAPSKPCNHGINNQTADTFTIILYAYNHSAFHFCMVFNKLHKIFNTVLSNSLCIRWLCSTIG